MTPEKPFDDSGELLLCFDDRGDVIPSLPRGVVHQKPLKIWHAIVNIWIVNNQGEILCTRRSSLVSGNPNKWQTYVGGHVRSDSDFIETALREIAEEIGLHADSSDLRLVEKGRREDTMHVYETYTLLDNQAEKNIRFEDGEVVEARWFDFDEYQKSKAEHPESWCNGMSEEQYRKVRNLFDIEMV